MLLLPLSRGGFVRFINCSSTEQGKVGRKKKRKKNFRVPLSIIYDIWYKSLMYRRKAGWTACSFKPFSGIIYKYSIFVVS